ncbi:MAG: HAD-IIB family hydrolase [Gammaproteobacteria bacterium]
MSERYLLCTDLDRTLLPNGLQPESACARPLFRKLVSHPEVHLAYVSGRSLELVLQAIAKWDLPRPDFILGDVGSSIYEQAGQHREIANPAGSETRPDQWRRLEQWDREIASDWNGSSVIDIVTLLAPVDGLVLQEKHKQTRFKVSYYVAPQVDDKAMRQQMQTILANAGIRASLIWSIDEAEQLGLLDVLPASATKRHAIEFLMRQQHFNPGETVFADDSGNDLPVLVSPVQSVLVANATVEVQNQAVQEAEASGQAAALYVARGNYLGMNGNYSAGILEGFVHYIPQAENWLQEASP